jgi:ABC-2 type transport system ATP-binding protein
VSDPVAIETVDLRKRYDAIEALRGLDLHVPAGSIFGFLGRNGAGKSTTIKILLGMARPTSGTVRVLGVAADAGDAAVDVRRRIGFVSEDKDLYDYMTVDEMVRFTASFYPRWRSDLEQRYRQSFELAREAKVKTLSRGARTKLALLLALCRGADLLILDEPTSGLDPAAAENVLQALVAHAARDGTTVFFSSHQIADVEQIADHVAIIDRGRTVVSGAVDDLRERYCRVQLVFEGPAPADALRAAAGIKRIATQGRVVTALCSSGADAVIDEARALGAVSVDVTPITLKDIFLETVNAEEV